MMGVREEIIYNKREKWGRAGPTACIMDAQNQELPLSLD